MKWRICLFLCLVAMAAQLAAAESSTGNVLTGEAKVDVIRSYSGSAPLARPEKVVVQEFTPVGEIVTDKSLAARLHRDLSLRHGSDEDSTPEALTQQVQATFSKTLIQELTKAHILSEREFDGTGVPRASVLIVEGEFIAVDDGNESKRVLIGFGRGASDVRTHVIVSSFTKGEKTVVLEFNLNSASGKKPGAVAGMGSLAIGAAVGGVGDRKANVQADASRTGKAVAKEIESFMIAQKWISPPSHQ